MLARIASHLRSNAVAYVALFFALSAGAYAATKAPKNSVVAKSIKKGAVKTSKLANGAVTEPKLADGAVGNTKLGDASVTESKIADGAVSGAKIKAGSFGEANFPPFTLTTPTLGNGWHTLTNQPAPAFGKDALGFVHMRGELVGGIRGTVAFTLPSGLRPPVFQLFSVGSVDMGGNDAPCTVGIDTDGTVHIGLQGGDPGCPTNGYADLSSIIFKAD